MAEDRPDQRPNQQQCDPVPRPPFEGAKNIAITAMAVLLAVLAIVFFLFGHPVPAIGTGASVPSAQPAGDRGVELRDEPSAVEWLGRIHQQIETLRGERSVTPRQVEVKRLELAELEESLERARSRYEAAVEEEDPEAAVEALRERYEGLVSERVSIRKELRNLENREDQVPVMLSRMLVLLDEADQSSNQRLLEIYGQLMTLTGLQREVLEELRQGNRLSEHQRDVLGGIFRDMGIAHTQVEDLLSRILEEQHPRPVEGSTGASDGGATVEPSAVQWPRSPASVADPRASFVVHTRRSGERVELENIHYRDQGGSRFYWVIPNDGRDPRWMRLSGEEFDVVQIR